MREFFLQAYFGMVADLIQFLRGRKKFEKTKIKQKQTNKQTKKKKTAISLQTFLSASILIIKVQRKRMAQRFQASKIRPTQLIKNVRESILFLLQTLEYLLISSV